jgi:hypothetical protein
MEKSVICLFYVGFEVVCFVTLFVFFSLFLDLPIREGIGLILRIYLVGCKVL